MEHERELTRRPKANRHKFQKLDEKLRVLHSELVLHGKKQNLTEDIPFHAELLAQGELILHDAFQTCFRQLMPISKTTEQVLYHLEQILAILRQALREIREESVLAGVLLLISALAR